MNFGPSEGLGGGSPKVGDPGTGVRRSRASVSLPVGPGGCLFLADGAWEASGLCTSGLAALGPAGSAGAAGGEVPSFSDQRLWLTAGSVVTIKSHSKQEKCVCILPSTCLGFRHISLGECPPADVYVLGFINCHTDTSRAHVGARPLAFPPTEAPAPWFQGSAACEAGIGGGELGGREAPSWRGSSPRPPKDFPEIARVLAQVLLSTYYVLLLPCTFGVLSSISGGLLLGTSCSICGQQGSQEGIAWTLLPSGRAGRPAVTPATPAW